MYENIPPYHRRFLRTLDVLGHMVLRPAIGREVPHEPAKILVVFLHGLGDAILASGVFRDLRKRFPASQIDIAADRRAEEFIRLGSWFDNVIIIDNLRLQYWANGVSGLCSYVRSFTGLKKFRYDITMDVYGDLYANFGQRLAGAPCRIAHKDSGGGFFLTHPLVQQRPHQRQRLTVLEVARSLVLGETCLEPDIPAAVPPRFDMPVPPYAVIAPGALFRSKRWPADNFAALAQWLTNAQGFSVILTGAESEKQLCEAIRTSVNTAVLNTAGRLKIEEVFFLIQNCGLFIGNDSALAHAAAAYKKPLVQIFSTGDPRRFGYDYTGAAYVQGPACPFWPCSPFACKNRTGFCIDSIPVDQVKAVVLKVLAK